MPTVEIQPKINLPLSLELLARQAVEGFITGLHKSPFHGFSVEFAEHRQYNTGEDTRHIDWKVYGKTDKLFVKRFEEETNLRCNILLDVSSSMYFPYREQITLENPNKLLFSAFSAATLSELLFRQRDAVGLTSFADSIDFQQDPKSSRIHLKNIYNYLEQLLAKTGTQQLNTSSNIAETLHLMAEKIHKRSLIVIFSDMFDKVSDSNTDALFSALQHLKFKKNEVILFHVNDRKKEIEFDYSNRPYRFVDMESNTELKINPAEIRKEYISKMAEYLREIKLRCEQYKIDFVEADINEGYSQVLQTYLVKRQRMF